MLLEIRAEVYADRKWTFLPPPTEFLEGEIARYLTRIPIYPDWFHNCGFHNRDVRALLTNGGNHDRFSPLPAHWETPKDCCPELREIIDNGADAPCWMLYSELLAYDWSKMVCKYARTIPTEEVKRRGLIPNLPDGSRRDLESHEYRDLPVRGYVEIELATKECVPELFVVLERIAAAAGTEPHLIRLYVWDM